HGPRERAHAGLVDPGNADDTSRPERALVAQQLAQALAFRAARETAPFDGGQDRLGAPARVGAQRLLGHEVEGATFDDIAQSDLGECEACHTPSLPRPRARANGRGAQSPACAPRLAMA